MDDFKARLATQADRVRASGIFGRSDPLRRLFDYLVSRAGEAEAPREFEIADALNKGEHFEAGQDASIRVHVHRLRRKLQEFYTEHPEGEDRLSLPRGAYRLVLSKADVPPPAPVDAVVPAVSPPDAPAPVIPAPVVRSRRLLGLALVAGVVAGLLAAGAGGYGLAQRASFPRALARTRIWSPLVGSHPRSLFVMGDQPLEGGHPHVVLTGSAKVLARMVPVVSALGGTQEEAPAVAGASYMPPTAVRESNVVYIGTLAQTGMLSDVLFARSGFAEPDETGVLTDKATGRRYLSEPPPFVDRRQLTSYGYLACMTGPEGNRILIISGTTDGAVVQMGNIVLDPDTVDALSAKGGAEFEALYAVATLDGVTVSHHLELVRALGAATPRR